MPILQGKLRGKRWLIGSGVFEYALGSYEYEKVKLFESVVKRGDVVYDIGAHVGFYTLLAAELVKDTGRVVAFEPLPQNLKYLKIHLEMNQYSNVTLICAAVSDKSGMSSFNCGSSSSVGHLSIKGDLEVTTVSLDELVGNQEIRPPNHIKIDAEGAEVLILKGAKLTLLKYSPTVFLSTHGREYHIDSIKLLTSLDYNLHPIIGDNLDETREIFAYKASANL